MKLAIPLNVVVLTLGIGILDLSPFDLWSIKLRNDFIVMHFDFVYELHVCINYSYHQSNLKETLIGPQQ